MAPYPIPLIAQSTSICFRYFECNPSLITLWSSHFSFLASSCFLWSFPSCLESIPQSISNHALKAPFFFRQYPFLWRTHFFIGVLSFYFPYSKKQITKKGRLFDEQSFWPMARLIATAIEIESWPWITDTTRIYSSLSDSQLTCSFLILPLPEAS